MVNAHLLDRDQARHKLKIGEKEMKYYKVSKGMLCYAAGSNKEKLLKIASEKGKGYKVTEISESSMILFAASFRSEQYNPIELAKAACNDKKAAKVNSCRPAKEKARKTPPTASCGNDTEGTASRKRFSFEAVGVNVGDKLSFIDGTEVVAVSGNKVEFCGEVFTLSGFCKEFMPDEKRTKSNSYRGCNFFFLDGVCLGKLFRDVMEAAPDVSPVIERVESVTLEIQGTDGIPEKGHISHEANNFEHKECEEKPNKGQTGRSDGKTALHPTVVPIIARKRNTGRFWPLFGYVATMEAVVFPRVLANVSRRHSPFFAVGGGGPPPHYAHNEGWMNSFRFYNNFKITKQ